MNVAIRADASSHVGSDHVVRCKTLAGELRRRGADVRFVCREQPANLIGRLADEGYRVAALPPLADVEQSADAEDTIAALKGFTPDWLVVDHYGLGEEWESRLRGHVGRILVIDDLANRRHACDALLDQNWFGAATERRYDGLVPAGCRLLLGPRYALLHPLFAQLRRSSLAPDGIVRRLLVFFGAVDSYGQTAMVLDALEAAEFDDLAVDVVIGSANRHASEIAAMAHRRGGTVHRDLPTLAGLMARVDAMAGAGGATTWERCCLGLSALVAVTADNQEQFTAALAASGAQCVLGHASTLTEEDWAAALRDFRSSPERVRACAAAARRMTDGLGVGRVATAFWGVSGPPRLRCAGRDDEFAYDGVTPGALVLIAEDAHRAPLGHVCVVRRAQEDALVDIVVDPALVGDGVSAALLRQTMNALHEAGDESPARSDSGFLRSIRQPKARDTGKGVESLRLTVLSDSASWLNDHVEPLVFEWLMDGHAVRWVHDPHDLVAGDICFLLGCSKILSTEQIGRHRHTLVVHESEVPRGRGWSPLTWQVLGGANRIPVTLLEAIPEVDAGPVYLQTWIEFDGTELLDELRLQQARATIDLCREWLGRYPAIVREARAQAGPATTYPRRTPADSELDPDKSLREQFPLLRVVDNDRYPAFFSLGGARYMISIRKDKPTV